MQDAHPGQVRWVHVRQIQREDEVALVGLWAVVAICVGIMPVLDFYLRCMSPAGLLA